MPPKTEQELALQRTYELARKKKVCNAGEAPFGAGRPSGQADSWQSQAWLVIVAWSSSAAPARSAFQLAELSTRLPL